jgi:hypothetical protein
MHPVRCTASRRRPGAPSPGDTPFGPALGFRLARRAQAASSDDGAGTSGTWNTWRRYETYEGS